MYVVGFYFRCHAQGELVQRGDGSYGHRWVAVPDLEQEVAASPLRFSWLTTAALQHYFTWRRDHQ